MSRQREAPVLSHPALDRAAGWPLPPVVLLGLLALYLPIYLHLAGTLWQQPAYSHGPLILLASGYLFWRQRMSLSTLQAPRHSPGGYLLFTGGLLLAWLGLTQDMPLLATAAQLPLLAAMVLLFHGWPGLRLVAFPLLFLLFMVPLPGLLVDALTLQLKEAISLTAVQLLHAAGYPVARSGVIIVIGTYQMLVADACSGLHSLITLAALGLLFIQQHPDRSPAHRAIMLAALLPLAVAANFLRTLTLLLLTYHSGDMAARTEHDATGLILFMLALLLLFAVDRALLRLAARRRA